MIDGMTARGRLRDRIRTPLVQLNVVGIVLVAVALVPAHLDPRSVVVTALGVVALACWATWVLTGPGRPRTVALLVCGPVAAVGAGLGSPSLIAPVIASLIVLISDGTRSATMIVGSVAADTALTAVSAAAHGFSFAGLLSLLAGVAFGTLGGYSRRQRNAAEAQRQALFASTLAAEREAERAALLEARSAAARDVHDVLAHSLGGLVIQLDAIEALLERGHVEEATVRASEARRLAGEGLSEARSAVAALRDPSAAAPVTVPDDALETLLTAHRSLGGTVHAEGDRTLGGLDAGHREAVARALREALVNARRHAPGQPVLVRCSREGHAMVLRVENPIGTPPRATPGGGHGLTGMRERFAALGDGSTVHAGADGDRFVVEARAVSR